MTRKQGKAWARRRAWDRWLDYDIPMVYGWAIPGQLATGSMPTRNIDADTLDGIGITHVLNVADSTAGDNEHLLFSGRGMVYTRIPQADPPQRAVPPAEWWEKTTAWAVAALGVGGSLYIHCHHGSSRGPSVAYATLRKMGWDDAAAYHAVRVARPYADLYYVPLAMEWLGDTPLEPDWEALFPQAFAWLDEAAS